MSRLASLFLKDPNAASDSDVKDGGAGSRPNGYAVLFVDDEAYVLNAMKRIFRQENYEILTAESGQQALAILEKKTVQIVVSDHKMPGMTGAELLREVKARYPNTIRIMLTGHADVNAIMGAVNEGAVYKFITKPWNNEDLRLTVSLALEQYDLIQENKSLKKVQEIQKKKISQLSRLVGSHRSQVGRLLVKRKLLDPNDLDQALEIQRKTSKLLPQVLMEMNLVDPARLIQVIVSDFGCNRVDPAEFNVPRALAELVPREICAKNTLIPLKQAGSHLIVAMADPTDLTKIDDLKFITGFAIEGAVALAEEIQSKIEAVFGESEILDTAMSELEMVDPTEQIEILLDDDAEETSIEDLLKAKDQPPAIRIVNAIISDALRHEASDVHIEPKTKYLLVRYRIDGLLFEKLYIPLSLHPGIVSRIKVMSEMDIAERRKPQDGRVTVKTSSRMVDMRISTLPTIGGEKVVLRLLDRNASIRHIEDLGIQEKDREKIARFISQPQGLVLSTGPTGSGKTSTLYALLQKGATTEKNYTTIEDPVEYFMGMAGQVMVKEKIGLTFPRVLRALLRQDPNVIMLGEIRDFETAEVAFHAALTGHLVLSTLHTNSSVSSITRLKDMGLKPYVISEALTGIIAQRLVRRICRECISPELNSPNHRTALEAIPGSDNFETFTGTGCQACNQTGFSGRAGIFEIFAPDLDLRQMIHANATEAELLAHAKRVGMTTLVEDALEKVRQQVTALSEIIRVLGPQNAQVLSCSGCSRAHCLSASPSAPIALPPFSPVAPPAETNWNQSGGPVRIVEKPGHSGLDAWPGKTVLT